MLSQKSFDEQKKMVTAIHAVVGTFVLLAVWFGRLGEDFSGDNNQPKKTNPADA